MSVGWFFFFIVVFVGYLILKWKSQDKVKAYQRVAQKTGLQLKITRNLFIFKTFQLHGTVNGFQIRTEEIANQRDTEAGESWTRVIVSPSGVKEPFEIRKEGFLSKTAKYFGVQDHLIGEPQLDKKFLFKFQNQATLRKVFDEPTKQKMLTIVNSFKGYIENEDGTLVYLITSEIDDPNDISEFLKTFGFVIFLLKRIQVVQVES